MKHSSLREWEETGDITKTWDEKGKLLPASLTFQGWLCTNAQWNKFGWKGLTLCLYLHMNQDEKSMCHLNGDSPIKLVAKRRKETTPLTVKSEVNCRWEGCSMWSLWLECRHFTWLGIFNHDVHGDTWLQERGDECLEDEASESLDVGNLSWLC
jgi:hypothetical protein